MFSNNALSTPEIKTTQDEYATIQRGTNGLEKTKAKLTEKLTDLLAEGSKDEAAKTEAHDKAVKKYGHAIAAGDTAAEAEADTELQSILGESDRSRGKRLARDAAITKLELEITDISQQIDQHRAALEGVHKKLLTAILYARAEQLRTKSSEFVAAAKRYQQVAQNMGIMSALQGIKIPLPPTHPQDRYDYIGPHSIAPGQAGSTVEELLSN